MTTLWRKFWAFAIAWAVILALTGSPAAARTASSGSSSDLANLTGDYKFDINGRTLLIRFTIDKGKLFATPPDGIAESLAPVEGQPLCFEVSLSTNATPDQFRFIRNDKGIVDTCVLIHADSEFKGKKVVKS